MKNKLLTILMFCLVLTLFIGQASAWTSTEFVSDETKSLDSLTKYGTYKIEESSWYDPLQIWTKETLKEIDLKENTDYCGGDVGCLSSGTIVLNKDGTLIDELIWKRSFDGGNTFVDWTGFTNWKILVEEDVDVYETQCIDLKPIYDEKNGTSYTPQECSQVLIGTKKQWKPLDFKKEYKAGSYNYKIEGGKKPQVIYDWIIKTNGEILDEWAVWGAVIGVGGVEASVTLNSPADDSIQYIPTVTVNASANVTGGAYLTNASLNLSVNGGAWEIRNTTSFAISDDGLVSYYTLDETSGTTAEDSVGSNDGTYTGSVTLGQTGIINYAPNFNNGNNYISSSLTPTTNSAFTWAFWTKTTDTDGYFMSSDDSGTTGVQLRILSNKVNVNSGGGVTSHGLGSSTSSINDGSWHFVVLTYDGTTGKLYFDGSQEISTSWSPYSSSANLWIGKRRNGESTYLNGNIDEVGIWNRALTPTEITTLYNSGAGSRPFTTTTTTTIFTNTFNAGDVVDFNYEFCDSDRDCGQSETRRFTIESTAPTITLAYPTSLIDYGKLNGTLQLNLTATDTNLDKVWYNYNGTNVTIDGAVSGVYNLSNITLSTKKNVTIYANDTAGNLATEVFGWDYKVFETAFIYNNETRAGDQEDYSLQLTLHPDYDLSSATLHFDGLTASPSIFSSGNNRVLNVTNYAIPTYTVDTNVSLWWDLVLDDATEITTENETQLVKAIFLDNCLSYSNVMFNISLLDEVAQTPLNGDIQFHYSLLNVPAYQVISSANLSLTDRNNFAICSDENLTNQNYVQSIEIRYVSDGYAPELYHIQRAEISPEVVNINLYDLNQSEATEFKLTYQDDSFNFVEGAAIQLMRRYISENAFKVVEAPLTSSDGIAVVHVDLDSIKYKAVVVKNGEVLDTFDNLVFKCQSELTGECELKLLGNIDPQNTRDYDTERDFTYSITSLNDSISITYSIPSSSPASVNLVLTQKDEWGNTTSCNKTVLSSGGSIECEYDETLGVSYLELSINKDGTPIAYNTYVIEPSSGMDFLDNNYIIVVILMLSLVGMALASPEWIVINGILTMLLAGMLWLVNGISFVAGLGLLMWLVIAAGILILKLAKQEDR